LSKISLTSDGINHAKTSIQNFQADKINLDQ